MFAQQTDVRIRQCCRLALLPHVGSTHLPDNFAFVMNVRSLEGASEHLLAPEHVLRRATHEETTAIKGLLPKLVGGQADFMHIWESVPDGTGKLEQLPEQEWRYFVVAFTGNSNVVAHEVEVAASIAPNDLEMGLMFIDVTGAGRGFGHIYSGGQLFHVLEKARFDFHQTFFRNVSRADAEAISTLRVRLQQNDGTLIDLKEIANHVLVLKGLPHSSPLRFLGFFALLESLLTHLPKPSDPYDSITRQVRKKIALLNHRWVPPLDYSPFGTTSPDTVWKRMYHYRSLLAHGVTREIPPALRSHDDAQRLLLETVKATIRYGLAEPRLLVDLRDC